MGWWILLGAVILVVLWLVFTYNGLITARNRTQEAWSEIDVELKRRHDLIPNLVNTVSGYMGHERGTLEAVTNARANAVAAAATGRGSGWTAGTGLSGTSTPELTPGSGPVGLESRRISLHRPRIRRLDVQLVVDPEATQRPVGRTEHELAVEQPDLGVQQHPFRHWVPTHLDPA